MRLGVQTHITIQGVPLCECELSFNIQSLGVYCSYPSIAAANRAKQAIQKHRHSVKVVRGECPTVSERIRQRSARPRSPHL